MLSGDMERLVYGSISWGMNLQTCTILIGPCTTCHGLSRRTCVTVCYKSQPGVSPLSLPYWCYSRVMYDCGCTGARHCWNTRWRLSLESWSFSPTYGHQQADTYSLVENPNCRHFHGRRRPRKRRTIHHTFYVTRQHVYLFYLTHCIWMSHIHMAIIYCCVI